MKRILTVDEHRALGTELSILRNEIARADRLNLYKRNSITARKLLRAESMFDKLRCKLDGELFKWHPTEAKQSIYYGGEYRNEPMWSLDQELWTERLRAVGDIINRKVSARVLDSYIRCDRALYSVVSELNKRPDDQA